jgi:hypothetical protein
MRSGHTSRDIVLVDFLTILKKSCNEITDDLYKYGLTEGNQRKQTVSSIVYHYVLYGACEIIKNTNVTETCILVHQYNNGQLDIIPDIGDVLTEEEIFRSLIRCLPTICYSYDGRYGDIHDIPTSSGEYKEVISEATREIIKPSLRSALEFSKKTGLSYMHEFYLTQPSIKLLFCK